MATLGAASFHLRPCRGAGTAGQVITTAARIAATPQAAADATVRVHCRSIGVGDF